MHLCVSILVSLPVLVSNFTLKLTNCNFLKFLPHELLISEPNIFGLAIITDIDGLVAIDRCLWMVILTPSIYRSDKLNCHVKKYIVKLIGFMVV